MTDFTPTPQMLEIAEAAREKSTMTLDEMADAIAASARHGRQIIAQILRDTLYIDEFIDEAYAEYAESVGKSSTEGMSDDEKQQALLIWTLKQGEGGSAD